MGDEAHVRLVDAHPERDRRHHDDAVLLEELVLVARARLVVHAGMVGERVDAALAQHGGELLGALARRAVDDAGFARMGEDEVNEFAAAAGLRPHGQAQVGPIEAVHEHDRRGGEQAFGDVGARHLVGGRRERHRLHAERLAHAGERHVFGTEVVSPLGDAVGLVDREQRHFGGGEERHGVGAGEPLGGHVKEPQVAGGDAVQDVAVLVEIIGRVEARGGNAGGRELRHLVAHQRDQRRHHHGEAAAHDRGQLIAQRLARAGRHDGEDVAPVEDCLDDLGLPGPEARKTEGGAQRGSSGGEVGHGE